ncbi:cobalt-precorrin 5A hydrolase [Fervidicella metallireducens]|uniref:cobalt-precorrin 5A hydrolase n=1 Tax=Fervidicella metallireducens TaxID=655338 RepID=UPI000687E3E7|nr:cobalt-precorrin 5A hydrolase [Fervidicella metallireducens]
MKLACIAFTNNGEKIAGKIKTETAYEVDIYTKKDYKDNLNRIFSCYEGIIFISSTGIAVRISTQFLKDKTFDPAVVVVDDLGRFAISLLSGHIGGANELAIKIANILNCQPVITTASDGRGIEAVDMFAKKNNLCMENLKDIKKITALMVEGKRIKLHSELKLELNYNNLVEENEDGIIFVTSKDEVNCDKPHCILRPKNLIVGIGCRRGKSKEEILNAINNVFKENNLSIESIKTIATVDIKADEVGIINACEELKCEMKIFMREKIKEIEKMFTSSEFVKSAIGVTSVCEHVYSLQEEE